MLYLLLRMGTERYALDARRIVEVVPMVDLKPMPHTPVYVAGLFDYRGTLVPVIDLCQLASGRSSGEFFTTRIVLVEYPGADRQTHTLGLLAEQVTETLKLNEAQFQNSGLRVADAPYLGELIKDANGLVQRIEIDQLLPAELRENLFTECA